MASFLLPVDGQSLWSFALGHLVSLVLLSSVTYICYQRFFSPLSHVPGPFFASLSRWWIVRLVLSGRIHEAYPKLHQQYGPLVRVAPDQVSIADPVASKKVFGPASGFTKSQFFVPFQGHRKFDLVSERDERLHGAQRRLVSRAYAMDTMKDLEPYIDKTLAVFFDKMDQLQGSVIDFGKWAQLLAFDTIGEITFSRNFGVLAVGDDNGMFQDMQNILISASWLGHVPWLWRITDFLSPVFGQPFAIAGRNGRIRDFTFGSVKARKVAGSDHKDLLGKLFDVHDTRPADFNMGDLTSMAATNVLAGGDTTSIVLRAVMYYLLKNPTWKAQVVAELDAARAAGRLSDPVKFGEAMELPVFKACVQEAMRVHHVGAAASPRVVPSSGLEAAGSFLPPGSIVEVNPYIVHFDKSVFGDDADTYNPGRWLADKDAAAEMARSLISWGGGSRICLGKNIATMEIYKIIPSLFSRYNIELAEPDKEWTIVSHFFATPYGVNVRMTPR